MACVFPSSAVQWQEVGSLRHMWWLGILVHPVMKCAQEGPEQGAECAAMSVRLLLHGNRRRTGRTRASRNLGSVVCYLVLRGMIWWDMIQPYNKKYRHT